jgi:hypothetical protein
MTIKVVGKGRGHETQRYKSKKEKYAHAQKLMAAKWQQTSNGDGALRSGQTK